MASCRICYAPDTPSARLLQPCACTGTHAYICKTCLCTWVNVRTQACNYTSVTAPYTCELCLQPFVIRRAAAASATRMPWASGGWGWIAVHDALLLCGVCGAFSVMAYAHAQGDDGTVKRVACVVVSAAQVLLCSVSAQVLWRRYRDTFVVS